MAKFTKSEKTLLKRVTHDRFQASLAALRQAAEDIWAVEAPRIIQDYTDHGIAHSERLAGFASQLLNANRGPALSAQQMYLLLAGIYLHDIGMQCDIVKFPEIRLRAEALGAEFDIEFVANTTSNYSLEEQKIIRKNHQYLSAAWIDHSYRTGTTMLGLAAKTIPSELINDLMDICKYHTKLSITDCPLMLSFIPNQRKQPIAALLRFADELDIDGSRVNIETVNNFRINPSNAVYWWLHNCTQIAFTADNIIRLTMRLHPKDVAQYGNFIYSAFISEFQRKNRPVLEILRQNDIPISIDAYSEIISDEHASLLPEDIVNSLQIMQQDPNLRRINVNSNNEGGIDTKIYLKVNDRVSITATGFISYSKYRYTNADGIHTNEKGNPLIFVQNQIGMAGVWPHPEAYRTNGGQLGKIGSLFGWIGDYSEDDAFLIGEGIELVTSKEGYLHLSVNDAKGTYGDNIGEYEVTIRILQ